MNDERKQLTCKEKYLTCKEFTELCGITKNTLVWYEKKGLIRPKAIGENGYHYYSVEQYFDVDLIKCLKWADNSLEDCQGYLQNRSERGFMSMLVEQQGRLEDKLQQVMQQKTVIDRSIQDLISMQMRFTKVPKVIAVQEQYFLTKQVLGDQPKEKVAALTELFEIFHLCLPLYGAAPSMFYGTTIAQEDLLSGKYNKVHALLLKINVAVPHPACYTIPAGKFVICFHKGNNGSIGKTYQKMLGFIAENHLKLAGDSVEKEFVNYLMTTDENQYRKEIMIPVTDA